MLQGLLVCHQVVFGEGSILFVDAVCVKGQTRKESQFHSVEKLQVRYDYDSWKVTSGSQWKLYFLLFLNIFFWAISVEPGWVKWTVRNHRRRRKVLQ